MPPLTLHGGQVYAVDLGFVGATVQNVGTVTVSYSDSESVRSTAEGTIAAAGSVTLTGVQFFYAPSRAELVITPLLADLDTVQEIAVRLVAVESRRLDQWVAAGASVDFGSFKAINLLDPTDAQDGATKTYADLKVPKSLFTAKGSMVVATAAGVLAELPAATDGWGLLLDSATATGVKWAALPANGAGTAGQIAASAASAHTITNTAAGNVMELRDTSASGYSATLVRDDAGTAKGVYGWGNASVAVTALRSTMFFTSLVVSTTVPGAVQIGQWLNNGVDFRKREVFGTDGGWSIYKLDGTSKVLDLDITNGFVRLTGVASGGNAAGLQNTHAAGYSAMLLYDNAGVNVGAIGHANGSAGFAPGTVFIGSTSADTTPKEIRIVQFLSAGGSNKTRIKMGTDGTLALYRADGTTKDFEMSSLAPIAGSTTGAGVPVPVVSLGPLRALSNVSQAANGTAHLVQTNGVENTLAIQSVSANNETYSAGVLLDEAGEAKFTWGFGNKSSLVWKRRAYFEAWCGQNSSTEVPDIIFVQSSGFPNLSHVRMRMIGCAPGGTPGDIVLYRAVPWPADTEPANSRALTIYADGTGMKLETAGAGYVSRSADGTAYKIVPPNGGGAATWVAA